MDWSAFHPAVAAWFQETFTAPTPCQVRAWQAVKQGRHTLIAAPTGSGKTLAAFLAAIDDLAHLAQTGELREATRILYISPLKALSNDVCKNLEEPLVGIDRKLFELGYAGAPIRSQVRTGDTPQAVRSAMGKFPPHILVTTPESAYVLLTSDGGRRLLKTVRTVIVDEIHAVAGSKRGSHLALTLERLDRLVGGAPHPIPLHQGEGDQVAASSRLIRIGLSATQNPIATVADFLSGGRPCTIIDTGHQRRLDLGMELPESPLEAVLSHEAAGQIYERMAELIRAHRTTLVFVNTRRLAERVSRALIERLGEDKVAAHHGSLAKEQRLAAEARLKAGELQALVATASLELGIDVGEVDLVCQLGTVGSIATFLQRVGRAGHQLGGLPKGRLFPASRDELIQGIALLDAVQQGELDLLHIPEQPLDVLAQQIVAMAACEDWDEADLCATLRRAWPYRNLEPDTFDAVVKMLAEGYTTRRGTRGAWLHRDAINRRLKARRGARLTALTCGGAIPDNAEYRVIVEPSGEFVGTVDEDFAIESLGGDIFQLGNASWRVLRLETSTLRVEDAHGIPPNIPFWFGEAPGRSWELSTAVARVRQALAGGDALAWLAQRGVTGSAARQAADYMAAAQTTLGVVPTLDTVIFERFFDEAGGMQFIIHAPYGSRVNRAWGLALRKRFCRTFNFELQAAATEDAVILSLGVGQSFPLEDVARFLHPNTVRDILVQALLAAPMFTVRWRWNAACALAIRRFQNGRKTPPHLLRMQAEDLVTAVFPDQLACFENIQGDRQVPDHPLVEQTVHDCLFEAMDFERFLWVIRRLNDGSIRVVAKDLVEPSPLAAAILNAKPYAFLDGAPLEERRTRAVASRRWLDPASAADLGRLDPEAIAAVRGEAWPSARDADELHDALLQAGYIRAAEADSTWHALLQNLIRQGRATILVPGCNPLAPAMTDGIQEPMATAFRLPLPTGEGWGEGEIKKATAIYSPHPHLLKKPELWIAAERWPWFRAVNPAWTTLPPLHLPPELEQKAWDSEAALTEIVRARLCCRGPLSAGDIAATLTLAETQVEAALLRLESEGFVLRGQFTEQGNRPDGVQTPSGPALEWCERSLLARIHRYTINRLRREIEPVTGVRFMDFLLRWQHVHPEHRLQGRNALAAVLEQLEGFEAAAVAWESSILAARLADYDPSWLDGLCQAGRFVWTRLSPSGGQTPVKTSPLAFLPRKLVALWQRPSESEPALSGNARTLMHALRQGGAQFFEELWESSGLLKTQVEDALAELVAQGQVRCDSFIGLRALLVPEDKKRRLRPPLFGLEDAGRWTLVQNEAAPAEAGCEHIARTLLRRYGVIFKALLARESAIPPWQDLLTVYRRLEARGDIRGGRFVANQYGEQFALPEAVELLRKARDVDDGVLLALSAVDPLNLLGGTLLGGTKLPALPGNRFLLQGGVPVAVLAGKEVRFLVEIPEQDRWELQNRLLRRQNAPPPPAIPASTHELTAHKPPFSPRNHPHET
ncbi:MAG: DEAD/DEAH box helicase [Methylococcaceae bacterium]|nr:MAG: DEAD/DEAH box helicase [Methylococcaceae bacterium]